ASAPQASVPYVPPRTLAAARAVPTPRRVTICTTPVTASEPYSTLAGPRSTSMRSTLSVVRCAKSKAPPGSFTGTPSTSTFTYLLWPPRRNSDVRPPKEPVWTTAAAHVAQRVEHRADALRPQLGARDHGDRGGHRVGG